MLTLNDETDFKFCTAISDNYPAETEFHTARLEISLILEGSLQFIEDGKRKMVEGPCACLQAYRHELRVSQVLEGRSRTQWCYASAARLNEAEWAWLDHSPRIVAVSAVLPALFQSALALDEDEAGTLPRSIRNALGRTIFLEYMRCATTPSVHNPLPQKVRLVKQAIEAQPGAAWSLASLAALGQTTPGHLISLFQKYIGMAPISYLWTKRHEHAVRLLRTTQMPIEAVAHATGYQSPAHFSRSVKKRTGIAPSQLRRGGV